MRWPIGLEDGIGLSDDRCIRDTPTHSWCLVKLLTWFVYACSGGFFRRRRVRSDRIRDHDASEVHLKRKSENIKVKFNLEHHHYFLCLSVSHWRI